MTATGATRTLAPARSLGTVWSWVPALAIGIGLFLILAAFAGADPASGVTFSASPWSDEGWNLVGARNFVLLGSWSTDQWNLYLMQLPFSVLMAAGFSLFGVGIVQARLLCIGMVALATLGIGLGLRPVYGRFAAALAALALATSQLILFYGRLAYLEDLVVLVLVLAAVTLARTRTHPVRWGLVAGVAMAVAVGAKTTAVLPVAGLLAGVAIFGAVGDRRFLRWSAAAGAVVAAAAIAWAAVIYLPNRAEIADDLRILAPVALPRTLAELRAQITGLPRADGLLLHTWPLLTGGVVGALVALAGGEARRGARGALLFGALGWLVVGGGAYALIAYQPNRYLVPMLPALAILIACGARVGWPWARTYANPWLRFGMAAVAALALAAPGLVTYASWMRHATYVLPTAQEQTRSIVPPGSVVFGGLAPTLLMRAPVVTIARTVGPQTGVDLYATRGARWFMTAPDGVIEPVATLHPAAWAARARVYCTPWRGEVCLFRLP